MPPGDQRRFSRRTWLRGAAATAAGLVVGPAMYAWWIEPFWVQITKRKMPLANLPASLQGKRIVQISDLHVGPVVDEHYLRGVLRRLATLEPDYVVITGDFMTCQGDEQVDRTIDTLRAGPFGEIPCFAVIGNHDFGDRLHSRMVANRLIDGLDSLGVQTLMNQGVTVDGLQFFGSDDLWWGRCHVAASLRSYDPAKPAIYLTHNPDVVDRGGWGAFRGWVLCGHTHGGQVNLPVIGRPILPIRNRRYAEGHIRLRGGRDLYVNRGLGYKRQIRFGVRPEITVFTLEPAAA